MGVADEAAARCMNWGEGVSGAERWGSMKGVGWVVGRYLHGHEAGGHDFGGALGAVRGGWRGHFFGGKVDELWDLKGRDLGAWGGARGFNCVDEASLVRRCRGGQGGRGGGRILAVMGW